MKKIIFGIIIALGIIGIGSVLFVRSSQSASAGSTSDVSLTAVTATSTKKTYTLADVSAHSNATSCWALINSKVYDLTNWINHHPGGPDKILGICGKDGSNAFNGQHSGQARPASELAAFYIAELSK